MFVSAFGFSAQLDFSTSHLVPFKVPAQIVYLAPSCSGRQFLFFFNFINVITVLCFNELHVLCMLSKIVNEYLYCLQIFVITITTVSHHYLYHF